MLCIVNDDILGKDNTRPASAVCVSKSADYSNRTSESHRSATACAFRPGPLARRRAAAPPEPRSEPTYVMYLHLLYNI